MIFATTKKVWKLGRVVNLVQKVQKYDFVTTTKSVEAVGRVVNLVHAAVPAVPHKALHRNQHSVNESLPNK